jgi:hypothetical protein
MLVPTINGSSDMVLVLLIIFMVVTINGVILMSDLIS